MSFNAHKVRKMKGERTDSTRSDRARQRAARRRNERMVKAAVRAGALA